MCCRRTSAVPRRTTRCSRLRGRTGGGLDVPTLLTTDGIDLLRWDALRLDATLREHGVPVVLDDAPGLWHAYLNRPELPEARTSYERIAAFVASALAR